MNRPKQRTTCRISGEPLTELFSLGKLYISDFIPVDSDPRLPKVELKMCLAKKSGLVQLAHTAPFDDMYREYWYRSGTNETMTNELKGIAEKAVWLMKPEKGDVWVDIGCNDGTLFRFVDKKIARVGFDPAQNTYLEKESRKHASHIVIDYFSADKYRKTPYKDKKAKIITSIAMFYDLEDPHSFIENIKSVMDPEGLWIIQMSYLPLMLQQLAFDNICHEHLKYYSLTALKYLLDQHGLKIVDSELNDVNGGSFRIYIRNKGANPSVFATAPYRDVARMRVASIVSHEKTLGLKDKKTYLTFYKQIQDLKKQVCDFIKKEKSKGKKIWGYGASTKGNTLLQYFGLDNTLIDAIAERSPMKFGKKTAGSNIPMLSEEEMRKARPDYLLVLPWHFIDEFKNREQEFLKRGGKFIVPCPTFEIISG